MIPLTRLPCPEILQKKGETWTERFLRRRQANPTQRPDSSKYAHRDIKSQLEAMSHRKCFYCERKLSESDYTVDHFIEVAEAPDRAFEWTNLYLCCAGCQKKLHERTVPRAGCLDPCEQAINPADHLTFVDEVITARDGSQRGLDTIRKYKLDRLDLELQRSKVLHSYRKALIRVLEDMRSQGRQTFTAKERSLLRRFSQADQPFSAMFRDLALPE